MTLALRIAKALRDLRKASGLTQAGLAERIRVEPVTVSRWERVDRDLALWRIEAILEALEVQPRVFFAHLYPPEDLSSEKHELLTLVMTLSSMEASSALPILKVYLRAVRRDSVDLRL